MNHQPSPEPSQRILSLGDIDLCVFEWGQGPLLILAHGITANGRVWDPIAERLAGRWRVVALDQRGHGRSSRPGDGRFDADAFAGDIVRVIEALGETSAVLVGHSLGGRNVMAAAASHPQAVRAIVSIDYTTAADALDFRVVAERLRLAGQPQPDLAAVEANLKQRYPLLPDDALRRRRDYGYSQRPDGTWIPLSDGSALEVTLQGLAEDSGRFLTEIACPALMLMGTLPGSVSPAAQLATQAIRPDIPTIRIADTDHFVHEERPAEVSETIIRWLDLVLPSAQ